MENMPVLLCQAVVKPAVNDSAIAKHNMETMQDNSTTGLMLFISTSIKIYNQF